MDTNRIAAIKSNAALRELLQTAWDVAVILDGIGLPGNRLTKGARKAMVRDLYHAVDGITGGGDNNQFLIDSFPDF